MVCLAMIRCICAFSASSFLSRAKSLVSSPAYFSFQEPDRVRVNAVEAAELRRRRAGLELFENPDDLSFAEAGLLQDEVSLGSWPEISQFQLARICPLRSARIKPLLQELDAQHLLKVDWRPSNLAARVHRAPRSHN
jgi:hypothetical protein